VFQERCSNTMHIIQKMSPTQCRQSTQCLLSYLYHTAAAILQQQLQAYVYPTCTYLPLAHL
jgi:hypothetical protein